MTSTLPTTTPESTVTDPSTPTGERADLLAELRQARFFLRHTARDLTDAQAGEHPTVSALCVGGLIKHVADTERSWARFIAGGATAMITGGSFATMTEADFAERERSFQMQPGETLAGVLAEYEAVAAATDELVATADLDHTQPLPEAPWNSPGAAHSTRRVIIHLVAETTQHAGHADILRETLDGAKSMG